MRPFVLAVVALVAVGAGQWLEKAVGLPDSLTGPREADLCVYSPVDNAFYVAGCEAGFGQDHCLLVVDGTTNERIAKIPLASGVRTMSVVTSEAKLYCAAADQPVVYVLDVYSRTVVRTLEPGRKVWSLSYVEPRHKLYCALSNDTVLVVDVRTDSVVGRVAVPFAPEGLSYSRQADKLYCTFAAEDTSGVAVIDCSGDSLLRVLALAADEYSEPFCNQLDNKLYVVDSYEGVVSVVDCTADTVLAEVVLPYRGMYVACHNVRENKVYFGDDEGTIAVVCGAGDSLLGEFYFNRIVLDLAYDSLANRVLVAGSNPELVLVDAAADTLVAEWCMPGYLRSVCVGAFGSKACAAGEVAVVLDPLNAELLARYSLWFRFASFPMAWSPLERRLYCIGDESACDTFRVAVVDGDSLRVRKVFSEWPPGTISWAGYSSGMDKLYVRSESLYVLDCGPDTVVAAIPVNVRGGVYSTGSERLYCPANREGHEDSSLAVVDCRGDSLVGWLGVPAGSGALGYNPAWNKAYVGVNAYRNRVFVVDCTADTVVAMLDSLSPAEFCYVPSRSAVFASVSGRLYLIGGESNEVEAWRGLFYYQDFLMAYNSRRDKLYCVCFGAMQVAVVDCSTLSVVARVPVDSGAPRWPVYDSLADKLYIVHGGLGLVTVLDCATDQLVGEVAIGSGPRPPAWDPVMQRLFVPCNWAAGVSVVRDTTTAGIGGRRPTQSIERMESMPTIVRRLLTIPHVESVSGGRQAVLFDPAGRAMLLLYPGANDVSGLAPGVYFVREGSRGQGSEGSRVRKVIV
ncbi:hypothetical protein JXB37_08690, partial [candidate division WOR-3 bacterium]|nr:hypothetical protein [candidate division WOR-3 bacterium]